MNQTVYPVELSAPDITSYQTGNTGIPYVTTYDSGVAGPHVMISALTHGNEICGAIALDYLFKAGVRPKRGKLTLGFVNHAAYERFDVNAPGESRFVDEDCNRVWVEDRLDGEEKSVELNRARAMRALFDEVDMLLDIHSMSTYSLPLLICNGLKKEVAFARQINYPGHVMCGSGHVVGKRLIEYTPFNDEGTDKVAFLVECGQHWARNTGRVAIDTALHFLRATDCVEADFLDRHLSDESKAAAPSEFWEVTDGLYSKTADFRFAEDYKGMEIIAKAGTPIAYDGGETVTTPYDECLLMMPNPKPGANMRKLRLCRRLPE